MTQPSAEPSTLSSSRSTRDDTCPAKFIQRVEDGPQRSTSRVAAFPVTTGAPPRLGLDWDEDPPSAGTHPPPAMTTERDGHRRCVDSRQPQDA